MGRGYSSRLKSRLVSVPHRSHLKVAVWRFGALGSEDTSLIGTRQPGHITSGNGRLAGACAGMLVGLPPEEDRLYPCGNCCHKAVTSPMSAATVCQPRAASPHGPIVYWLAFTTPNGVCVVLEPASSLIHARVQASLAGLQPGEFKEGHAIDAKTAKRIPDNMIGKRLSTAQAGRLLRLLDRKAR